VSYVNATRPVCPVKFGEPAKRPIRPRDPSRHARVGSPPMSGALLAIDAAPALEARPAIVVTRDDAKNFRNSKVGGKVEYDVSNLSAFLSRSTQEFLREVEEVPWYEEDTVKIQKVENLERTASQTLFLESGKVFCRMQEVPGGVQAWLTRLLIDDSNRKYPDYDDDPRIVALTSDVPDSVLPETVADTIRTGIALKRVFATSVDLDTVREWAMGASAQLAALTESANRRLLENNNTLGIISSDYIAAIKCATKLNAQLSDAVW
jgi:hypothetical protein